MMMMARNWKAVIKKDDNIIEIIGTHSCYKERNSLMIQAFNSRLLSSSGITKK